MSATDVSDSIPSREQLSSVFHVYEVETEDDRVLYYGEPIASREDVLKRVRPLFREYGYQVTLSRRGAEHVLVAAPRDGSDGVPWLNVGLFVATVLSTLYVGSAWYYIPGVIEHPLRMLRAWPFAAAVMGVLGVHELGHYALSRYHDVDASLPYFIPLPTIIGTAGAVIRMRDRMPSRKALFDIGVAGPLAGLVATVVVTAIGLWLPPITVPERVLTSPTATEIRLGFPLLFQLIAAVLGETVAYESRRLAANPVVFGGWVGMFVTFLNLLPVGQLDGGHIVRALFGQRQETVAAIVPGVLFGLAGYLYFIEDIVSPIGIWLLWGFLALLFARAGPANPVRDEPLDRRRKILGLLTLGIGLLCFTPVPIQIVA